MIKIVKMKINLCVDCIFESHSGHQGIKAEVIEDLYKKKLNNHPDDEYIKFGMNLKNKIDEIKNKINEGL